MFRLLRLEVEGGFLDNLDIEFAAGLNVLIGPRGTGKTSVVELLRFGLGASAVTRKAQASALEQARSVLGGGRVLITAEVDGQTTTFERNGSDEAPRVHGSRNVPSPLFVGQNELEAIGLDADGRRRILDRVVGNPALQANVDEAINAAAAAARRREDLRRAREAILDRLDALATVPELLAAAEADEQTLATQSGQAARIRQKLEEATAEATQLERRSANEQESARSLRDWSAAAAGLLTAQPNLSGFPEPVRAALQSDLERATTAIQQARDVFQREVGESTLRSRALGDEALERNRRVRAYAAELESLHAGAGDRARRVADLRRSQEIRRAALGQLEDLERQLLDLEPDRTESLDAVDSARDRRFEARAGAASELTARFSHEIEFRLTKLGATAEYASALGEALRGSGMQYKALAQDLATRVSPRELVDAVDRSDIDSLASAASLSTERAERVIAHLRHVPILDVLLCPIEDSVDFALLDGQKYKTTGELSMGQRCTVVLPLLLAEGRSVTVLDQPEDHLDNAFVVDTVVRSLRARSPDSQLVIATHNANIPVLGDAERVIVMGSNGRTGFSKLSGDLRSNEIVDRIKLLMEGGSEAFARRAAFYSKPSQ